MAASVPFQKTQTQEQALALLSSQSMHTLLFGGSRSGKTFILIYALLVRALKVPESRHMILRAHSNAVRYAIGCDTLPKVLRLAFPKVQSTYYKSDNFVRLPNGSEVWLGGLDDEARAEKILGREFSTLYFNECSEIDYRSVQTALTRLAQRTALRNRVYYDCNPPGKSHWSYQLFILKKDPLSHQQLACPEQYASMVMNPDGNRENLPQSYLQETLMSLSFRQRQRFLEGVWLDDNEHALFQIGWIDRARVSTPPESPLRVVIGVDPAVSSGAESDLTGIIGAALGRDGDFYILSDASCRATPNTWATRVCQLAETWEADRIVGEVNQGGDLIAAALQAVHSDIPFQAVRALRGKTLRAEPVAALYEQGKVHHVGSFPDLEEQMVLFPGNGSSPDRLDALVWAITSLSRSGNGHRAILA